MEASIKIVTDLCVQLPEGHPPACVVHGPQATGKSSITRAFLEAINIPYALVRVRECITTRHLLESTLASCFGSVGDGQMQDDDDGIFSRCENTNVLAINLQRLLRDRCNFILVFDGMDNHRESLPNLLPALARLGYLVF